MEEEAGNTDNELASVDFAGIQKKLEVVQTIMPGIHALNYVGDDPEQASREVREASETRETISNLNKEFIKAGTSFG